MARHRRDPACETVPDSLSFTEAQISDHYKVTTLLSVEPRIVSGELFWRVQQWKMFDRDAASKVAEVRVLGVCTHIHRSTRHYLPNLIPCKMQHRDQEGHCITCHPLLRCSECDVEFQVDLKQLGDRVNALVVTKWLNLVHGETPLDPKWRRHLCQYSNESPTASPITEADRKCGIRGCFEQKEGKLQSALTEDNASRLLEGLYRKEMKRCVSNGLLGSGRVYCDTWIRQINPPTVNEQVASRASILSFRNETPFLAMMLHATMILMLSEQHRTTP